MGNGNRVTAAGDVNNRGTAQQRRQGPGIERGRHHQQAQVFAQQLLALACKCKPQIRLQGALMKFVEDDQLITFQGRILQQHPRQDALGHHLHPHIGAREGVQPRAQTH